MVGTTSYIYNSTNVITLQNTGNLPLTVGTESGTNYAATAAAALPTGKVTFTENQTSTTLGTVALDPTTVAQSFVTASTQATGSNDPTTVTLADVNGDGKPDMLIGTSYQNGFIVELGNGDGTYQAPQTVVGNGAATNIVVADLNGDGKLDVIVADGNAYPSRLVAADLNLDGKLDLVSLDEYGYPITASVTGSNLGNYTVTVVPGTLTVTPAALTITVANATRVYGTANPAFTSTLAGVENGDTVPVTYSTGATTTTGVGSYAIAASTTDANYTATVVPGTLKITPATLKILVNSFTKVYGSANPTFTGTVSGLLFSDTVTTTYETTAVQFTYVGAYAITASISGGQSANYTAAVTNGILTIIQALLKIVANNGTKVYGTANPAFSGTVTGILNNDAVVTSYSSPATVKTTVGSYANIGATISGIPAVNYSPQVTDGTLKITPAR